jgi:hypothetical protein
MEAKFVPEALDMLVDRPRRDAERGADLSIGEPATDQGGHLPLAIRQHSNRTAVSGSQRLRQEFHWWYMQGSCCRLDCG